MERSLVFGLRCGELLASYDQKLSFWKTCQESLPWGSEKYSEDWPQSGMMQNGKLYQLEKREEHPKLEEGFLLWPTPSAHKPEQRTQYKQGGYPLFYRILEREGKLHIGKKYKIHPDFVNWLMGFPIGWTDLEP